MLPISRTILSVIESVEHVLEYVEARLESLQTNLESVENHVSEALVESLAPRTLWNLRSTPSAFVENHSSP